MNRLVSTLVLTAVLALAPVAEACVGARALGMGGAFVGVADDVSAVYWNPAGLAFLEEQALTYMGNLNTRDVINYDDFLAYAGPWRGDGAADFGLGLSMVRSGLRVIPLQTQKDWYQFSMGIRLPRVDGLAVGANVKYYLTSVTDLSVPITLSDGALGVDISALYRSRNGLSLGVLVQDINDPTGQYGPIGVRNVRLGASYRLRSLLVTGECYNITAAAGMTPTYSLGAEMWVSEAIAIRAGVYHGTANATFGLGIRPVGSRMSIDIAYLTGDLANTIMVSGTLTF